MNAEYQSRKWLTRAMLITQIGTLIVYGEFTVGFAPAIFVSIFMAALLYFLIRKSKDKNRLVLVEEDE